MGKRYLRNNIDDTQYEGMHDKVVTQEEYRVGVVKLEKREQDSGSLLVKIEKLFEKEAFENAGSTSSEVQEVLRAADEGNFSDRCALAYYKAEFARFNLENARRRIGITKENIILEKEKYDVYVVQAKEAEENLEKAKHTENFTESKLKDAIFTREWADNNVRGWKNILEDCDRDVHEADAELDSCVAISKLAGERETFYMGETGKRKTIREGKHE